MLNLFSIDKHYLYIFIIFFMDKLYLNILILFSIEELYLNFLFLFSIDKLYTNILILLAIDKLYLNIHNIISVAEPYPRVVPEHQTIRVGESAVFSCMTSNTPVWTFNGGSLPYDVLFRVENFNEIDNLYSPELMLEQVEKWHSGYYECLGKDRLTGEVFQNRGELIVLDKDEGKYLANTGEL